MKGCKNFNQLRYAPKINWASLNIKLIQVLNLEIDESEKKINSLILSIPRINYRIGVMIIAKTGDFRRIDSTNKIIAYAYFSPSIYQPKQQYGVCTHMRKQNPVIDMICTT